MNTRFLRWALWAVRPLAVLALLGWGTGADSQILERLKSATPQTTQVKAQRLTLEQEQDLGREMAAKLIAYFHLYSSEALTRYVNLVGLTVAAQSDRQDVKYHFAVLDTDEINEFSAPGGYIFITRGTLALCEDESELAGVLAHEVGHVAAKHVVHGVERTMTMLPALEASQVTVPGAAQQGVFVQQVAKNIMTRLPGYVELPEQGPDYFQQLSRNILVKSLGHGLVPDDEYDADKRGATFAHAAGYRADGLEHLLLRVDKTIQEGGNSLWVPTQPPVRARIDRLQKFISEQHWEDTDRPRLPERLAQEKAALPKVRAPQP